MLHLNLLGAPQILLDDQPLAGFTVNKAQALLFYLAVNAHDRSAQPRLDAPPRLLFHSRDTLSTLLWSEMTDTQAKQNLRTVLPKVRRLLGNHLQIDRQRIAFDTTSPYWLDVEVFRKGLMSAQAADLTERQALVDLYREDFLSGFHVNNAPAFEDWVLEQREQLHALMVEALFSLVREYTQGGDYGAALAANRRLLVLEPWSEPVHQQQIVLLALTGERAAALAQYDTCRSILAEEFGVAPLAETTLLYEQIRTGEWDAQKARSVTEKLFDFRFRFQDPPLDLNNRGEQAGAAFLPAQTDHAASNRVDEGWVRYNVPSHIELYGRQAELTRLHQWIVEDDCRLVGILGIGGQGKTALVETLIHHLAESVPGSDEGGGFTHVIWQSLVNAPPLEEVIQEWMSLLSDQAATRPPASLEIKCRRLIDALREHRCLLVLDNLESVLQSGERSGYYRPDYADYGQLIRQLAMGDHQSCLLFTSRESPQDLIQLEEQSSSVRFLFLAGLSVDAGRQMIQTRGLSDNPLGLNTLVEQYSGNPLALKLAVETVVDIFDSDVTAFLETETVVFDDIRDVLDQQFARLAPLEYELICWLAIAREPSSYLALRPLLAQPSGDRSILEAMRSLQRRSLLEKYEAGFGLQNVVLEYITEQLVDTICHELLSSADVISNGDNLGEVAETISLSCLNRYALILAQTKEYVRASQRRLLLQPVAERLVAQIGGKGTEQHLQRLLAFLRTVPPMPGYVAANILHLLLHLEVCPTRYNFSGLHLRQLHLRGVSLPRANFAKAEIMDSAFTEPFGLVFTVVFSPDGRYLAAGTSEGDIYLWRTADQQLVQILQVHRQAVWGLCFGLRSTSEGTTEVVLASASDDQTAGFWSLSNEGQINWQVRLVHKEQKVLNSVGIGPTGTRVSCVDSDGSVFVWDVNSASDVQLVHDFATTQTRLGLIAYRGDGHTVVVGNRNGTVQLYSIDTGALESELHVTTGDILELALSPDGRFLATGGDKGHICLWSLPDGQVLDVMQSTPTTVTALAFSADGRMLTSAHGVGDQTVRLWQIDARFRLQLRQALRGHTHSVWSANFGPRPAVNRSNGRVAAHQLLVTGSNDQTVRVWDVQTGHSLYTLRGQPRGFNGIALGALSPKAWPAIDPLDKKAWLLAGVRYDGFVHLWNVKGGQVDSKWRTLRGSGRVLGTVDISPDGRLLAAAGLHAVVHLWDVASGRLCQKLYGHSDAIESLVFHPSGDLLVTSSINGEVRFWASSGTANRHDGDMPDFQPCNPTAVIQGHPSGVEDVTISPSGHLLATVGEDTTLRLWDLTQPHFPELESERRTVQVAAEQDIYCVAFSPDEQLVACGGSYLIHLWNLQNTDPPRILQHHTAGVYSVAFSPDGATLASGGVDCTVCLWDVASGALRATLHGHTEIVFKIVFSPDGDLILSCSADGSIRIWDMESEECVNIVQVEGPYAEMNITVITGVTDAQKAALKALGAVEARAVK